jgi:hypothetical protein
MPAGGHCRELLCKPCESSRKCNLVRQNVLSLFSLTFSFQQNDIFSPTECNLVRHLYKSHLLSSYQMDLQKINYTEISKLHPYFIKIRRKKNKITELEKPKSSGKKISCRQNEIKIIVICEN